ncbi:double-transmembrane region domain protein [Emticicia oligotrophica DSM 17448]|uniref:Double-transmembrane region domain protein n=1 Tax=Emticicia oligotrophica (strain DSM 17448 / CIP 109782 / MTCC 6937 / GPTSA100-15) TaxID=929562 RepID=A0ABM5N5Y9_EMTOG|nr:BatA domain-containing protein [Emticicia oligotrophica]AFK04937.1 double-transmembrane region domain protein [Emticicia oligotrophica DSM 17448]
MELLYPYILWGSLAVGIPVIIHFWHQKKGKLIAWAATQWLSEKNLQQSRGIRLDNILLLIIRCLLLLLFVFILSKPLLIWTNASSKKTKTHLIEANRIVFENFKFEIDEALKKGEECYWINDKPVRFTSIEQLPSNIVKINAQSLQSNLNEMGKLIQDQTLELYLINQRKLTQLPQIFSPTNLKIHSIIDSTRTNNVFAFSDNKTSFIDADGQLKTVRNNTNSKQEISHEGIFNVGIFNKNTTEKKQIIASLSALKDIYEWQFQIELAPKETNNYDIIFSDKPIHISAKTLGFFSNSQKWVGVYVTNNDNEIIISKPLTPQTNEWVFNAYLPEFIGEKIIQHWQLNNENLKPLSEQQLKALFKIQPFPHKSSNEWFDKSLILVFILLLCFERWLAISKNA